MLGLDEYLEIQKLARQGLSEWRPSRHRARPPDGMPVPGGLHWLAQVEWGHFSTPIPDGSPVKLYAFV
jgi:hypothetical protein